MLHALLVSHHISLVSQRISCRENPYRVQNTALSPLSNLPVFFLTCSVQTYLRYANACFFFGHVDEWALDDFSVHLNGMFVCSSTAYFHVTFMNSRYVQIEVCYKHRNSHISGTRVWTCSLISGLLCIFSLLKKQHITSAAPMMIVSFSPSTHLVSMGYVPFPPYQNGFVLCV